MCKLVSSAVLRMHLQTKVAAYSSPFLRRLMGRTKTRLRTCRTLANTLMRMRPCTHLQRMRMKKVMCMPCKLCASI